MLDWICEHICANVVSFFWVVEELLASKHIPRTTLIWPFWLPFPWTNSPYPLSDSSSKKMKCPNLHLFQLRQCHPCLCYWNQKRDAITLFKCFLLNEVTQSGFLGIVSMCINDNSLIKHLSAYLDILLDYKMKEDVFLYYWHTVYR